jgi:hypothetical protein
MEARGQLYKPAALSPEKDFHVPPEYEPGDGLALQPVKVKLSLF